MSHNYNNFSRHKYKVSKVNPSNGKEITSVEVTGSRAAFREQQNLEEQGLHVAIFNMTRGTEEYRTGQLEE